jgi:DNA phosphorothioation-associated DGQHR protein 1
MADKYKVLEVKQPLGNFYVFTISAFELLQLVKTNYYYVDLEKNSLVSGGIQRRYDENRGKEIANFLRSTESALPNSIIIAGNTGELDDNNDWRIIQDDNDGDKYLYIPEKVTNGTIIDGQHRLFSFKQLEVEEQKQYELLCTLYLDLPNPYQAYLFATINMNQKKVDKSLAYELYGYDLDDTNSDKWSPEKLAVFLTRKLNLDLKSPFRGHILLAAKNDKILEELSGGESKEWVISTAAIVEGILSLITNNAQRDRDVLQMIEEDKRSRENLLSIRSTAPLRNHYINKNDLLIYTILLNFFEASHQGLYKTGTVLFKTVGIQVQFTVLKRILQNLERDKDISVDYFKDNFKEYFEKFFVKCDGVDFSDGFFQLSGIGKTRMKNVILHSMGLFDINEIKNQSELTEYKRILGDL